MFSLYWQEAKKNISDSPGHSLAMILMFAVVFCIALFSVFSYTISPVTSAVLDSGILKESNIYYHGATVSSMKMYEINALSTADKIDIINGYFHDLSDVDGVSLGAYTTRPLMVDNFKGTEKFLENYEYGAPREGLAKALVLYPESYNIPFVLSAGRGFTEEDMVWREDKVIPVLLGYEYSDIYKVGEIISEGLCDDGSYTYSRCGKLEVIGFLREDFSVYSDDDGYISLDRYVILPYLYPPREYIEEAERDSYIMYLEFYTQFRFSANAIFVEKDKVDTALPEMERILEESYPFNMYYRIVQDDYEGQAAANDLINSFYIVLAVVLSAFTVVSLLYAMKHTVQKNIRDFSQHMCLGSTRVDIANMVGLHVGALLLIADGVTLVLSKFVINDSWLDAPRVGLCVGIVGGLNLLLAASAWIIGYKSMPSKNISDIIK